MAEELKEHSFFDRVESVRRQAKSLPQTVDRNTDYLQYYNLATDEPMLGPNRPLGGDNYFEPYYTLSLTSLHQDQDNLLFNVVRTTYKPKIERYRQANNVRYKIFSLTPSITTKNILVFNSKINVPLFCENQILKLKIPEVFRATICYYLNYQPKWLYLSQQIATRNQQIIQLNQQLVVFKPKPYQLKPENLPEKPSNFFLRLLLVPFTFGFSFSSLLNYVSRAKAKRNQKINADNHLTNLAERSMVDQFNEQEKRRIQNQNAEIASQINRLQSEITELKEQFNHPTIFYDRDEQWIELRDAMKSDHSDLMGKIGVYVIWNKTKNKYYVGQTHNLYRRIFTQHFDIAKQNVKNILFALDWFNGDQFFYRVIPLEDPHQLNRVEKENIAQYDAFQNGYNSTNGNKN